MMVMNAQLVGYMRLMRPANIVTAFADIMLGFAASGAALAMFSDQLLPFTLFWLLLSTSGLYGGGVVLNDVFDAELDKAERPERPIPSGTVSLGNAAMLGFSLLFVGILAAFQASFLSGVLAVIISLLVLLYDSVGKHHALFGPFNMGLCRGFNLLLGVSAVPAMVPEMWFIALIPIAYIGAITSISRGEVHGGDKTAMTGALILYVSVVFGTILLSLTPGYNLIYIFPFLLLFLYLTLPALVKAYRKPGPVEIRTAVKACVIALIALDATMAAGFAGWGYGLMVILLLPVSIAIAKAFAVT